MNILNKILGADKSGDEDYQFQTLLNQFKNDLNNNDPKIVLESARNLGYLGDTRAIELLDMALPIVKKSGNYPAYRVIQNAIERIKINSAENSDFHTKLKEQAPKIDYHLQKLDQAKPTLTSVPSILEKKLTKCKATKVTRFFDYGNQKEGMQEDIIIERIGNSTISEILLDLLSASVINNADAAREVHNRRAEGNSSLKDTREGTALQILAVISACIFTDKEIQPDSLFIDYSKEYAQVHKTYAEYFCVRTNYQGGGGFAHITYRLDQDKYLLCNHGLRADKTLTYPEDLL